MVDKGSHVLLRKNREHMAREEQVFPFGLK